MNTKGSKTHNDEDQVKINVSTNNSFCDVVPNGRTQAKVELIQSFHKFPKGGLLVKGQNVFNDSFITLICVL